MSKLNDYLTIAAHLISSCTTEAIRARTGVPVYVGDVSEA